MTQAATGTSGLVRVTVASGSRRVDLVLPGVVPVAELLPELARSVGLLDAATVYGGYRLVLPDGRVLAADTGLIPQGVEDGGVLSVSAGVDEAQPRVYDDVVEAMTDVVERDLTPWRPAAGRRTALLAAALLLLLGAGTLLVQGGRLAGVAAAVISIVLIGGAVVLSRSEHEADAGVAVAWLAAAYGVVAGLILGDQPLTYAGVGLLAAGLLTVLGLDEGRALVMPEIVVGAVLAACGAVLQTVDWRPAVLLSIVLVGVVLVGSVFPWLALSLTRTDVQRLYSPDDIAADPPPIDPDEVGSDARTAHEILLGISATVGALLVVVAPFAVSLGVAGALVPVAAALVVMLRTRQYRTGSEVLVGLVSGILGLIATGLAVLWLHHSWRPTLAVVLAAAGGVLLALTMVPAEISVRRGRLGDLAETICLIALLPLLVLATGVISQVSV